MTDDQDPDEPTDEPSLTRRQALKVSGSLAGAGALSSDIAAQQSQTANIQGGAFDLQQEYNTAGDLFVGPNSARTNVGNQAGRLFFGVDQGSETVYYSDSSSWTDMGLGGTADRTISSAADLESLPTDIQAGETVRIEQPDTPYRPASWPDNGKYADIDVSNVQITCESPFAADGQAVIKPADGSDIGGLLIGSDGTRDSNIIIDGWGWDGNESTMDSTVKRLHAITVENAENVEIRNCFTTETHPYQEHGSGGSGYTVRDAASDILFVNCSCVDIGDRGFQVAGDDIRIISPKAFAGFDRSVAFIVTQPDGNDYHAHNVVVSNGVFGTNSEGSIFGVAGTPTNSVFDNLAINNCVAEGSFRQFLTIFSGSAGGKIAVSNCSVNQTGSPDEVPKFIDHRGSGCELTVADCNYNGAGVTVSQGISVRTSGSASITGCRMFNVTTALEVATQNADVHVGDCELGGVGTSSSEDKVLLSGAQDVTISNSTIDGTNENLSLRIKDSSRISVQGCRIINSTNPNAQVKATDGTTHTDISINGCQILNGGGKGLVITETSGTINHYMITSNIIRNNGNTNLDDSGSGTSKVVTNNIAP